MNTFPVNLLLGKRKCLLVGGGKVASRKLLKLLDAGAEVTVIAPEFSRQIGALAAENRIVLHPRNFQDSDLDGAFLVYAATDDHALNLKITGLAEQRNILVCSVDQNWIGGSFITPATIRNAEITVAVSSSGVACRKARLIKDNLSRHIVSLENTELLVIGTDHNYIAQQRREPLHLGRSALERAGGMIANLWGIQGFVLLNTCNRIELIAAAHISPPLIDTLKLILNFTGLDEEHYYVKTGFEAFAHLCLAAGGLFSQTPGENHITAQMKDAWQLADEKNWGGSLMNTLRDHVLHASKHIRNETAALLKTQEIEDLAYNFIESAMPQLSGCNAVIAGTGSIGAVMKKLLAGKAGRIEWLYHSQCPEAAGNNVFISELSRIKAKLPAADLLVTALASEQPAITAELAGLFKAGAVVVDLGVPRNVAEAVAALRPDITVTDMEDLKKQQRHNDFTMEKVFAAASQIIGEHRELYEKFVQSYTDGNQGQQAFAGADAAGD
ncbi:MAG: NAD(P)-dependent oxidoreductase [Victivallaceae bacterium]|jgi:glutamyl-tRNA reductase